MEPLNLEEIKYTKISQDNEINSLDSQSAKSNENFFSMKNSLPPPPTPFDLNQEYLMNNDEKEKIFENNSKDKEKTLKFLLITKEKRGRKKYSNKKVKRIHNKNTADNLLKKIQVHYLSFIVSYLNEILKNLNYNIRFLKLDYRFKMNVSRKFFESLKKKTIGEIISSEISVKYKKSDKNINKKLYEQIKDNEVLNKIFEDNYLKLFRNIYYKSNKIINFKEYGLNKDIYLSNNVKMLNDLLKTNEDLDTNKKYLKRIKEIVIKNFFPESIFILK